MKKQTILFQALAVGFLLSGCIPSVYPLYTPADVVTDDNLVGEWRQPNGEEPWRISKAGTNTYHIVLTDKGGEGHFVGHLLRIQDKMFLDITPDQSQMGKGLSDMYQMTLLPTHLFFYVRQIEPVLEMAALNPDWFKRFSKEHPTAISFKTMERDPNMFLILSETRELQKFVLDHMEAFSDFSSMTKKTQSNSVLPQTNKMLPWSPPKDWEKVN